MFICCYRAPQQILYYCIPQLLCDNALHNCPTGPQLHWTHHPGSPAGVHSNFIPFPPMLLNSLLNTDYAAQVYAQYQLCCSTLCSIPIMLLTSMLSLLNTDYPAQCSTMRKSLILLRIVNLFFNFYRYMMRSKQHQLVL